MNKLHKIMKKFLSIIVLFFLMTSCKSTMEISLMEYGNDVQTEWIDGKLWVYKQDECNVVGMTAYPVKDNYGKYYQVALFIMNVAVDPIIFDPADVSAMLGSGTEIKNLEVYTNEEFQQMIERKQRRDKILYGIAAGLSAGSAGYSTTYVNGYDYTTYNPSAATLANIAVSNQMYQMESDMEYDKRIKEVGYLKKNTVYPGQGISGYMNIASAGDGVMEVCILVGDNEYTFQWIVGKANAK